MRLMRYVRTRSYWTWIVVMKRLGTQHGRFTFGLILTFIFFASYTLLENSDARLKNHYRKKNILPIVKLADYDTEDAQEAKRLYPRQILFWTSMKNTDGERDQSGIPHAYCLKSKQLQKCPYKCDFTTDRSYFEIADAVVFDSRNLKLKEKTMCVLHFIRHASYWEYIWSGLYEEHDDIPEFRMNRQFWIFYNMEPPSRTWINLKPFEGLFNWTMTYRRDSDVYTPYGHLILKEKIELLDGGGDGNMRAAVPGILGGSADTTKAPKNISEHTITHTHDSPNHHHRRIHHTQHFTGRKLVSWIDSDCQYDSHPGRSYIEELRQHIPVDIFGKCGKNSYNCTPTHGICGDPQTCFQAIGPKYKFLLAFENALCQDYVTDKFYNALRFLMVPVVFGYGDYSKVAPRSSYINARSFQSPKELANYLLFLDKNQKEYIKYLAWRRSYLVEEMNYFEDAWCTLCEKLWKAPLNASSTYQPSETARNLESWWYHSSDSPLKPACSHFV